MSKQMQRGSFSLLMSFLLAFGLVFGSAAPQVTAAGSGFTVIEESRFAVAPGALHTSRTLQGGGHVERVNVMEIDPQDEMTELVVTSPKGKVAALDTVRNQAKSIDREGYRVVGGFNMDFFNTDPNYAGIPSGLQISGGELVTAPLSSRTVLAVQENGSVAIEQQVGVSGTVTSASGVSQPLSGVNRPRTASATNHLFLYTSNYHTTTKSAGAGVEIVIQPSDAKLTAGKLLSGTVEAVYETANNQIPYGKWVLSASGEKAAWLKAQFAVGQQVQVQLNLTHGLNGAKQAVAGGVPMVWNGVPTAEALADNADRHPRTFVGLKAGKLYVITFDGRQPTYSDGVTIAEGAEYLAELGIERAFNADGGGSTTYAARLPGDAGLSIVNSPSDGFERAVSNALLVVSTAPQGELTHLVPQPQGPLNVLAGGTLKFAVKGQDQYYNPVTVDPANLTWAADAAIGTVAADGIYTAGNAAGQGVLTVRSGDVSQQVIVQVVDQLAKLELTPNPAIVNPGSEQTFAVQGYDSEGEVVLLSPDLLTWGVTGGIGTITTAGVLTAVSGSASGTVTAAFGAAKAEAAVNVGKAPVMIENFEDITDLYHSSVRANSAGLALTSRPNPVRYGTHAAKLSYDFTGTVGTSAAYVNFRDPNGKLGRTLEERPAKLGVWVYGDSNNHWLRTVIQDSTGKRTTLDLTLAGGLNWTGWKYVSVNVPQDLPLPIKLNQLYVVETSNSNKNSGAVYFDDLRAVYSDTGEDLVGPAFSSFAPTAGQTVYTNRPQIAAVVKDEGKGVDAGSLKMTLNGEPVAHSYDASTGRVSYTPAAALADGTHRVVIDGVDVAGNPALPKAEWAFTVYTGPDVDAPTVSVISPHDGITTRTNRPRIAVQVSDAYTGVDFAKTKFLVDGQTVAYSTDPASSVIWFTPPHKWESGTEHQVAVTAYDKNNNSTAKTWSFTIGEPLGQPKNANQFQLSIIGDGGYYAFGQGSTAADVLLREQIARINQEPSELIGYTGDIVENDTPANYALGRENMELFQAPYVVSIGNHEISGTNSRANYQKTFGEPTWFYDFGNTRLIGLDSASGKLSNSDRSQWLWLEEVLDEATQTNILLFMHVPPDEISKDGVDFNTGHGFKDGVEAKRFYDLLGQYKAQHPEKSIVVLSGDLHAYHHKTVQGVEYIISGGGGKYTHTTPEQGGFYHYVNLKISGNEIAWDVIPLLDQITFTQTVPKIEVGEQATFQANGKFLTHTNVPITMPIAAPFQTEWASSDPSVATVNSNGVVTALAPGDVTITVKSGWREASAALHIPSRLTGTLPEQAALNHKVDYTLTADVHAADAGKQVQAKVTLSNPEQAASFDLQAKLPTQGGNDRLLKFDEQGVAWLQPEEGFPLTDGLTIDLKVKLSQAGIYEFKIEFLDTSNGTVITSKNEKITAE